MEASKQMEPNSFYLPFKSTGKKQQPHFPYIIDHGRVIWSTMHCQNFTESVFLDEGGRGRVVVNFVAEILTNEKAALVEIYNKEFTK